MYIYNQEFHFFAPVTLKRTVYEALNVTSRTPPNQAYDPDQAAGWPRWLWLFHEFSCCTTVSCCSFSTKFFFLLVWKGLVGLCHSVEDVLNPWKRHTEWGFFSSCQGKTNLPRAVHSWWWRQAFGAGGTRGQALQWCQPTWRFGAKWPRFRMIQPEPQDDPPRRVKNTLSKQTLYCSFFWHVVILCLVIAVFELLVGLVCDLHHIHRHHRPPSATGRLDGRVRTETVGDHGQCPLPRQAAQAVRSFCWIKQHVCFCLIKNGSQRNGPSFWEFEHFDN